MNRRGFLGLLGGTAAAVLIADALPSSKTFFLPPAGGWRASDLTEASIEAQCRRILEAMANSLRYTKEVQAANVLNRGFGAARLKEEGGVLVYDDGI